MTANNEKKAVKPKKGPTPKPNKRTELCKCGKNPVTPELHPCPFQHDINGDGSDHCNCCSECIQRCVEDI